MLCLQWKMKTAILVCCFLSLALQLANGGWVLELKIANTPTCQAIPAKCHTSDVKVCPDGSHDASVCVSKALSVLVPLDSNNPILPAPPPNFLSNSVYFVNISGTFQATRLSIKARLLDNTVISLTVPLEPTLSFTTHSDSVSYLLYCTEGYYGSGCGVHCIATDNSSGHYTCDCDGNKVCRHGYTDPSSDCTKAAITTSSTLSSSSTSTVITVISTITIHSTTTVHVLPTSTLCSTSHTTAISDTTSVLPTSHTTTVPHATTTSHTSSTITSTTCSTSIIIIPTGTVLSCPSTAPSRDPLQSSSACSGLEVSMIVLALLLFLSVAAIAAIVIYFTRRLWRNYQAISSQPKYMYLPPTTRGRRAFTCTFGGDLQDDTLHQAKTETHKRSRKINRELLSSEARKHYEFDPKEEGLPKLPDEISLLSSEEYDAVSSIDVKQTQHKKLAVYESI